MKYAVTPNGAGRRVGARAINDTESLAPGETFTLPEDTLFDGKVLASDGISLRAINNTDRRAERDHKIDAQIAGARSNDATFEMRLIREMAEDIAALKLQTPAAYMADLVARAKA